MSKNNQTIFLKSYVKPLNTKSMVTLSLLIAMEIILTRFLSIQALTLRISFGFLPIIIICIFYGPVIGGAAGAICDILGMLIFPKGAYFFGFTLSAAVTGIIYGFLLYKKKLNLLNISVAIIIVTLIVDMGLNTLWLSIMYNKAAIVLLIVRGTANAIMVPVKIVTVLFVYEAIKIYFKNNLSIYAR